MDNLCEDFRTRYGESFLKPEPRERQQLMRPVNQLPIPTVSTTNIAARDTHFQTGNIKTTFKQPELPGLEAYNEMNLLMPGYAMMPELFDGDDEQSRLRRRVNVGNSVS